MNCLHCQAQNPGDALFCESCGSRLEVACPNCGAANRFGARFCKKCGQQLIEAAQASLIIERKFGSVETYTPKHLAEKILNSKNSLEGERKQVTVLFADIKGSTKLLENLDPEEGQKLIDPVLRIMMDAVHRYEGTVNQVLGDGIMALFGAPLAHEDHALRANGDVTQEFVRGGRRRITARDQHQLYGVREPGDRALQEFLPAFVEKSVHCVW